MSRDGFPAVHKGPAQGGKRTTSSPGNFLTNSLMNCVLEAASAGFLIVSPWPRSDQRGFLLSGKAAQRWFFD